jgi:hypothetical protein
MKLEYAERLRLDAALTRIVDDCGNGADWRVIVDARNRLGEGVVMVMAQDAALKLRTSRVDPNCNRQPRTHKPRPGTSPLDTP